MLTWQRIQDELCVLCVSAMPETHRGAGLRFGHTTCRPRMRHNHLMGAASRSQSALHMHVLVCICSNVRQFHKIIGMMQMYYHTIDCT